MPFIKLALTIMCNVYTFLRKFQLGNSVNLSFPPTNPYLTHM